MDCDAYFDDAYTRPAYIAAGAGLRQAVRFSYRPALIEERSRLVAARRRLGPRQADEKLSEFVSVRVLSWNLADDRGRPLAVSAASVLECGRELFARLAAIVLGYACSDLDPTWPDELRDEHVEAAGRAAGSGRSVAAVREEREERRLVLAVSLLLSHPRLAERSCDRCRQWMYDDEHRVKHWNGDRLRRPPGSPTPCWKCPKKNPAAGAEFDRMLPRIERLIDFYFLVRATWGRVLDDRRLADSHLLRDLAIVDRLMAGHDRSRATSAAARPIAARRS